jgi:3-oxoacyl-[acyl-carrier protein] reductase
MEISLSGRSAIVTGGSKGIGLAVATRFAQSAADVAIVARGKESLDEAVAAIKKSAKARVIGVQADVGIAADIQRGYDEVMKALRQGRHHRQQRRHLARHAVREGDR